MDTGTAQPAPSLRLLVVDDHPLVRRGLALLLDAAPDVEVVGAACDGQEALQMADRLQPDVVIMDLAMPHLNGVAATRELTRSHPGIQVVILTTFDDDERVFDAICAGAHAYLLKDATEDEVLETVRAVHRGESRLSPVIAMKVLERFRELASRQGAPPLPGADADAHPRAACPAPAEEPLTAKETRVLQLIADGLSNKQIAERIFLAEGTVKNYVSRIMGKLHASSRVELALLSVHRHSA